MKEIESMKKRLKDSMCCTAPDKDVPKMLCGHPLPCPQHTAIIDVSEDIAVVKIPITAKAALKGKHHLEDIAAVLLIKD